MVKPEIDPRIVKFIKQRHILTLATCNANIPYCSNMFYAWMGDEAMFVFTSSEDTKHIADVRKNAAVAGSVVLDTRIVGKIRGIQFTGEMSRAEEEIAEKARRCYLKRFPYAALADLTLWVVRVNFIKMTDNALGFGKKLVWKAGDCSESRAETK